MTMAECPMKENLFEYDSMVTSFNYAELFYDTFLMVLKGNIKWLSEIFALGI